MNLLLWLPRESTITKASLGCGLPPDFIWDLQHQKNDRQKIVWKGKSPFSRVPFHGSWQSQDHVRSPILCDMYKIAVGLVAQFLVGHGPAWQATPRLGKVP